MLATIYSQPDGTVVFDGLSSFVFTAIVILAVVKAIEIGQFLYKHYTMKDNDNG